MRNLGQNIVASVILVTMALILLSMSVLGLVAFRYVDNEVVSSLRANAEVVGASTAGRLERGVRLGIPLDRQVGVEPFLERIEQQSDAVSGFAVLDAAGVPQTLVGLDRAALDRSQAELRGRVKDAEANAPGLLQQGWATANEVFAVLKSDTRAPREAELISHPLQADGARVGTLYVAIDQGRVLRELQAVAIDIGVVMGVAVLLALEVLLLVVSTNLSGPLTQLFRILRRLIDRDFTSRATITGGRVIRETLAAANAIVDQVDKRAVEVRNRLADFRDRPVQGRHIGTARKATVEERLAQVGRFGLGTRQRLQATNHAGARAAAFLFVLAEELLRPFLPLYIERVTQAAGDIASAPVIAAPMSAFLLTTALAGPFVAAWSDRVGRRRTFLIGATVSSISLAGSAFAVGFADLIAWRALAGVGYATTFAACQGHVIDQTSEGDRTRGLSVFVGGIFSANICGPALGGILAVQVGYTATICTAAVTALVAAGLAYHLMGNQVQPAPAGRSSSIVFKAGAACATNLRFTATLVLAAVPAKMLLTGFLFFTVPIVLRDLGVSESSIGRLTMLYGIAALLLMPMSARLCDRFQAHGALVGVGGLISGIGLIPMLFGSSLVTVAGAILALGVGQALSISAQTSLLTMLGRAEIATYGPGPVLGAFRLSERLGSAAGPVVAAILSQHYGYVGTATAFGFAAITLATLFSALFLSIGIEREDPEHTLENVSEASA
jgi:predicted MFS family arabinose efflux permease